MSPLAWTFKLPGHPLPWQRARRRGGRYFQSPEQAAYQERLRWAARLAHVPMLIGPVELELLVAIAHRKTAYAGGSGDGDNFLKQVGDSLNKVCWADDCQVVRCAVTKTAVLLAPFLEVRIIGTAIGRSPVRLVPNVVPRKEMRN